MRLSFRVFFASFLSVFCVNFGVALDLSEDLSIADSQSFENLNTANFTLTLQPNASLKIEQNLQNSGTIILQNGASIQAGGDFENFQNLFFYNNGANFASIGAQNITLDSGTRIGVALDSVIFGKNFYTLLKADENLILDENLQPEFAYPSNFENPNPFANLLASHLIMSKDFENPKTFAIEFELSQAAQNASLDEIFAQIDSVSGANDGTIFNSQILKNELLKLDLNALKKLEYLKSNSEIFAPSVISAIFSSQNLPNTASILNGINNARNLLHDELLSDVYFAHFLFDSLKSKRLNSQNFGKNSEFYSEILAGQMNLLNSVESHFGAYLGARKSFGAFVLGAEIGKLNGGNDIRQSPVSNTQNYEFASVYAQIVWRRSVLDLSAFGALGRKKSTLTSNIAGFALAQNATYRPRSFGADLSFSHYFRLARGADFENLDSEKLRNFGHFIAPIIAINAHYTHIPTFSQNGALPFEMSNAHIFASFSKAALKYLYVREFVNFALEFGALKLIESSQNDVSAHLVSADFSEQLARFEIAKNFAFLNAALNFEIEKDFDVSVSFTYKTATPTPINLTNLQVGARFAF